MDYAAAVDIFVAPAPDHMRTQAAVADATPARRLRDALEPVAMHAVWAEPVDTATGRATVKPHACLEADGLIADRAITERVGVLARASRRLPTSPMLGAGRRRRAGRVRRRDHPARRLVAALRRGERLPRLPAQARRKVTAEGFTAAVARARQHAVGDLLHRTARRVPRTSSPSSPATCGSTYAEFDAAVNRAAHALADRGLGKGDRLALLSHNCWQFAVAGVRDREARRGAGAGQLHARRPRRSRYILRHSGARGIVAEDALAPTAEKALAAAGIDGGVRGWIGLSGAAPVRGWEDVDGWWRDGDDDAPDVPVGRRRPAPADVHSAPSRGPRA